MTEDDQTNASTNTGVASADAGPPNATAGAFAAALMAGLRKFGALRNQFKEAADEAASRDTLLAYLRYWALANDEQEAAIRNLYPRAELDWNKLEKRARAHSIAFSVTAHAHHRAAVLDYLDNPGASTLIAHKHLTWFAPIQTNDLQRNADNWRRYQEMCTPLRNRDIAHDRAVRSDLTELRHLPSRQAAYTVAARPRPQP
jgi:hypothetical protein